MLPAQLVCAQSLEAQSFANKLKMSGVLTEQCTANVLLRQFAFTYS